ncbi:DUF305 domain-containing protein [Albitalea terrae]|uniref:DUF305 domain-containing protein n=2 Tax=Piscinibacter terrae TaxID=2496871 RepID=A0A3N7HLR2_9BURK|nr:DUF305 domain-containing protein [Albitalea terrae]
MKTSFGGQKLSLSLASAVLSLFAITAQAQGTAASQPGMKQGQGMSNHGSDAMHQTMMKGMGKMNDMKPSGDTDKDFAMMMKMHHEQALEMAQAELDHGKSAEMKAMAKKIIAAQKKEIAEFDGWMKKHP